MNSRSPHSRALARGIPTIVVLIIAIGLGGCPWSKPKAHQAPPVTPVKHRLSIHKRSEWEMVNASDLIKHINNVDTVTWGLDPSEPTKVESIAVIFWWRSPFAAGSYLSAGPMADVQAGVPTSSVPIDTGIIYPYKLVVTEKNGGKKYKIDPGIIIDGPQKGGPDSTGH